MARPLRADSALPTLTRQGRNPVKPLVTLDQHGQAVERFVAEERALTIYVDRQEIVTLMTLGTDPEWLTLGYLLNQGLIDDLSRIRSVQVDWEVGASVVTTWRRDFDASRQLAKRTVTSGCGQGTLFGDWYDDALAMRVPSVEVRQSTLYHLADKLLACNPVYRQSGSVHSCAICSADEVLAFAEDVGRHNAVDMLAGRMAYDAIAGGDKLFYTTGRLTSEMVIKVAKMGIPTLFSRSGLTGAGVDIAEAVGLMLIVRLKGRSFQVVTGQDRFVFDVELPPRPAPNSGPAHQGRSAKRGSVN